MLCDIENLSYCKNLQNHLLDIIKKYIIILDDYEKELLILKEKLDNNTKYSNDCNLEVLL